MLLPKSMAHVIVGRLLRISSGFSTFVWRVRSQTILMTSNPIDPWIIQGSAHRRETKGSEVLHRSDLLVRSEKNGLISNYDFPSVMKFLHQWLHPRTLWLYSFQQLAKGMAEPEECAIELTDSTEQAHFEFISFSWRKFTFKLFCSCNQCSRIFGLFLN